MCKDGIDWHKSIVDLYKDALDLYKDALDWHKKIVDWYKDAIDWHKQAVDLPKATRSFSNRRIDRPRDNPRHPPPKPESTQATRPSLRSQTSAIHAIYKGVKTHPPDRVH